MAVLIKPQFEVGRERVGKGGVVRDPALHQDVCARIEGWVDAQLGWRVQGSVESPITGPEGNREFLLVARNILLPQWEKVAKAARESAVTGQRASVRVDIVGRRNLK